MPNLTETSNQQSPYPKCIWCDYEIDDVESMDERGVCFVCQWERMCLICMGDTEDGHTTHRRVRVNEE